MTELGPILSRLGLAQYFQSFIEEGFDTWETVLDITEPDLDALNVKLGHRRRLQREIASARGCTTEPLLTSPTRSPPVENGRGSGVDDKVSSKSDGRAYGGDAGGKRKYRRHPKYNSPTRLSNSSINIRVEIREELRPQNLSFTNIAKRVGESWQVLLVEEKEPYESQASAAKEKYHSEMAKYKKTDAYKEYTQYLADFKAKNATNPERKRPKLETEVSTASSTSAGSQVDATESLPSTTVAGRRLNSVISMAMHPSIPEYPSSGSVPVSMAPPTLFGGHSALRAASPGSISSLKTYRGTSAAQGSPRMVSHIQPTIESSVDRNTEVSQAQPLPRIVSLERRDTRMLPANSSALLTDPTTLVGRTSPQHGFRRTTQIPALLLRQESTSSKSSSIASSLSSGASTSSSVYKPVTPHEDGRSQRFLPPLSPADLKPVRGSAYGDSGGQSIYPPFVNQSNSAYTLPPPLNSPFLSSPSSEDIPPERRSLKNLTLIGTGSDPGNDLEISSREAPEVQRPPHRPFLPNPHRVSSERDQTSNVINEDFPSEAFPSSHADPLSVLAYAGRIVDRGGR
ncbi:hypothetical protein MMC29_006624 [Sticta canariensis]|nr:hypothetical protein [Sticta canariensis]